MTETEPRWHHYRVDRDLGWRAGAHHLHGPDTHLSVEWHLLDQGFGVGFQLGRNGGESDLGLDLYLGRVGSVWLRCRSPWTRWLRIQPDSTARWWEARHYGVRLFPYTGCWLRVQFGEFNGMSRKARHWREWSLSARTFLGLNRSEWVDGDSGATRVPMPEGNYGAIWTVRTCTTRYTAPLGRLLDAVKGPRTSTHVKLDIPGGIPVEGKGENSWDCGMDGVLGSSGQTVEDAIANVVRSVTRMRNSYGGPHDLPHPMTITEASQR